MQRTSPFRDEGEGEKLSKELQTVLLKHLGADTWYDWCVKNWGTKWDITADLVDESEDHLSYAFQSAWSPPDKAIETISAMYPKLSFELDYEETGACFYGKTTFNNGEALTADTGDIEYDKEFECPACKKDEPNEDCSGRIRLNTDKEGECEHCGWHK